ncbi:hypothetical protein Leryth_011394 [Lithospermum erythrorhizon]|nr:hypothetical protein Leryth_011394 [Lithospermum erythrorhizon]
MSSSKNDLDSRRSGKAPEKSNFASTCNLLTQYLKEKGKLKELSRSISGNLESIGESNASQISKSALLTKNLSTNLADLNQPPIEEATTPMEELPSLGQMVSQNNKEECSNKASTSKHATTMESKSGQMTILYDGKIWVFDDLAANKAYELMILASKGNTTSASTMDRGCEQ